MAWFRGMVTLYGRASAMSFMKNGIALADDPCGRGGACSSRLFMQEYHRVYMVGHNDKTFGSYILASVFKQL